MVILVMLTNKGEAVEADTKLDSVNDVLAEEKSLEFRQATVDNVRGTVGYFHHTCSWDGHVCPIDLGQGI